MWKYLIYSVGTVLYYLLIVFFFRGQDIIFPTFMISAFIFSFFIGKREVMYSFSLLTLIWIGHLFRDESIISNVIIYLIFTPLTFLLGYYLKKKHFSLKITYCIILVFIGVYGFSSFWFLVENFNARKIKKSPELLFIDNQNEIRLDTIKNKIVIIDFWTTNCGVCFQKFPDFEKVFLKYKENPNILFYAANIPLKTDLEDTAKKKIEKFNYKFPVLYAKSDLIPKELGFNKYPHLVILKNMEIRFSGYPNLKDDDLLINTIVDDINELLKK